MIQIKHEAMLLKISFNTLLLILACMFISGCEKTSEKEEEMEPEEVFVGLEGKYSGGWTSTTETTSFTDFPVTTIFRYSNTDQTKMTGDFFATGIFKSCCELDDDGEMKFDIENDSIKKFYFDDKIVDCEGVFRGEGIIEDSNKFTINFTGNDCDGNHIGVLVYKKQ